MFPFVPTRRIARAIACGTLSSGAVLLIVATPAVAGDVAAGRNLEVAPAIDFVLFEGAEDLNGQDVRIDVHRGTTLVATKTATVAGGQVEVNHVGGADCFEGAGTPDIRPGDKVSVTVLDGAGADTADVDWTFARDIRFTEDVPGTLTGTAFGNDAGDAYSSTPLVLGGDLLEAKRVGVERFDGPIETVAADGSWTTTLDGEDDATAETFVDWVGTAVGGGDETTTGFPDGTVGELACGPLRQSSMTQNDHPVINAANVGQPMVVGGPLGGVGTATEVTFGGTTYTPDNGPTSWSATIPATDLAAMADAPAHALVARFSDGTSDTRSILKDVVRPTLVASLAGGIYTGAQTTTLSSSEPGAIRYTLDGTAPADATAGTNYGGIPIDLPAGRTSVLHARTEDAAGNLGLLGPVAYDVRQPVTPDPGGKAPPAGGGAPTGIAAPTGNGLPAANPPQQGGPSVLPALRLSRLTGPSRMKLRTARRFGIAYRAGLPAGTKVLQVSIARRGVGGAYKRVMTLKVPITTTGTVTRRLRSARLRAELRRGTYRVSVAAGRSASTLGAKRSFRVILTR